MADTRDVIQIDVQANDSEAERLKRRLAEVRAETAQLKDAFDRGAVGLANYRAELRRLESDANRTQKALDAVKPPPGTRLTGQARQRAASQLGFGAVNTAQDVIQGGPASGINNIIGLASQGGVRSLVGEFVAAAGGATALAAAVGTVAVVAGSAFLVVNKGLKDAKLDWSDLDDVIGNLGPWKALEETAGGVWAVVSDNAAARAVDGLWGGVKGLAHSTANYALGWDDATAAAKKHKDEVAAVAKQLKEAAEAAKLLATFRSDEQKQAEARGKLVGGALADLGGAGGIDAVADRLAAARTTKGGDEKVTRGDETKTRREWAKLDVQTEMGAAARGDRAALGRLLPQLRGQGLDTANLEAAGEGRDTGKEEADQRELEAKGRDNARKYDKEQREKRDKEAADLAKSMQGDYNLRAASGLAPDVGDVQGRMEAAGVEDAAGKAEQVAELLVKSYTDTLRETALKEGLSTEEAAKKLVTDQQKKDRDKAKQESEQHERDSVEQARKALPGLDRQVQTALMTSRLSGGSADQVIGQLKDELVKSGMGEGDAATAASKLVEDGAQKLGDKVEEGLQNLPQMKGPTSVGVADFATTLQNGQDYQRDQLDTQKQMLAKLVDIERKGGGGVILR